MSLIFDIFKSLSPILFKIFPGKELSTTSAMTATHFGSLKAGENFLVF